MVMPDTSSLCGRRSGYVAAALISPPFVTSIWRDDIAALGRMMKEDAEKTAPYGAASRSWRAIKSATASVALQNHALGRGENRHSAFLVCTEDARASTRIASARTRNAGD
jgi:hypothetical protein